MNELKIFENPRFGEVRTLEEGERVLFCATDIARALGYSNPHDAIRRHCKGVVKREGVSTTTNQHGVSSSQATEMNFIPEGDIYRLAARSELPGAAAFESWIFDEVLPSIRRNGMYATEKTTAQLLEDPDFLIQTLQTLKEEREQRRHLEKCSRILEQRVSEYEPKARYVDEILKCPGCVLISQIAEDYGMSAKALNKLLHEEGVQYNMGGQWLLYKEHQNKGLTRSETVRITRSDGRPDTVIHTKWTQKGRLYINQILEKRGIVARMDRE